MYEVSFFPVLIKAFNDDKEVPTSEVGWRVW
jgi:hypothetical protein